MILEHRNKAGTSICVTLFCILATVLVAYLYEFLKLTFNFGYISIPMVCIIAISYLYSLWNLAKAKGYSGFVGILLSAFFLLGAIILFKLEDKTVKKDKNFNNNALAIAEVDNRCPRCDTNYEQNVKICPDCQIELG